ncbi:MAG: FHA domain-containing protein [Chromatiaceae bacterium]|nr:FHA domain-containing protein [Chromatiaceae bacterium]
MAALIVEILGRHGHQYHKIDKPAVRVGRALDNDIILPDPAVSPYHFILRQTAGGIYELVSLADENGIRMGRQRIDRPLSLQQLPLQFDAGRTRVRILDSAQPVEPTRLISCRHGGACLFGHWGWALALFAGMLMLSAFDNYLSTPRTLGWESFWRDQLVITMSAIGLSAGLLVVNRITSHRWDYPSALSFVSLMLITAFVLDQFIPFADYLFTSALPGYLVSVTWFVLALPFALGWYLISLNHGSTATSILMTIVLLTPAAYIQLKGVVTHYDLLDDFSKKAFYSQSLYPWDKRLKQTISIDQFAQISAHSVSPDMAKR